VSVRLEILGDDGEWHYVPGVTSAEFHPEPAAEQPDDQFFRRQHAFDALVFSTTTTYEPRRPRVIDQDGNPVQPRPDRPAWQSPYGPPSRRH
jgi:hypothetical protein